MENLVPISICVILPIAIVLIRAIASMNSDNRRAQILIKAIETNNSIDANSIAQALGRTGKTDRQILNARLLRGCMFTLTGVMLILVGLLSVFFGSSFGDDPVSVPMMLGALLVAVGASYLIVFFVTRKQLQNKEEK